MKALMKKEGKGLTVQMLDGFSMYYDENPVVPSNARNSKVILLLQYLLCNRGTFVRQDVLIDALLGNADYTNPAAVLKNLVYRLRRLFKEAGMSGECILRKKNAYCLRMPSPCTIDVEEFVALADRAMQATQEAERFKLCLQAADLYRGGFLPRASGEFWAMGYAVYLQGKYCECLRIAYTVACKTGCYEPVLEPLRRAVGLYPYEDELCAMFILTLHKLKRSREAVRTYEKVTDTMLDDLGIEPSERMRSVFATISGGMKEFAATPTEVRRKIREDHYKAGAYYCNIEVFAEFYRIIVRDMERSGRSVYLMLCTVSNLDGSLLENGPKLKQIAQDMRGSIEATLRRGDVYTRYSPVQFVVMLMDLKQEDCRLVEERLCYRFYKTYPKNTKLRLTCRTATAADIDSILERDGAS